MKPFSTYPEDREELMALARTVQTCTDAELAEKAADKLSDLVLAILSDESAALAAAPASEAEPDGWRPIETAPRDGTSILTYPHYRVTHWEHEDNTMGEGRPGFVRKYDSDWEAYWLLVPQPTHWVPLPSPPALSPAGERT